MVITAYALQSIDLGLMLLFILKTLKTIFTTFLLNEKNSGKQKPAYVIVLYLNEVTSIIIRYIVKGRS